MLNVHGGASFPGHTVIWGSLRDFQTLFWHSVLVSNRAEVQYQIPGLVLPPFFLLASPYTSGQAEVWQSLESCFSPEKGGEKRGLFHPGVCFQKGWNDTRQKVLSQPGAGTQCVPLKKHLREGTAPLGSCGALPCTGWSPCTEASSPKFIPNELKSGLYWEAPQR